jgi:arginase
MNFNTISLVGIPMDSGKRRTGCLMGPDAYRTAGIATALSELGHQVTDRGNLAPDQVAKIATSLHHLHALEDCVGWTSAILKQAATLPSDDLPIFLGGDHALALGTVPAMANRASANGRPLFVLWLDAHADINTPQTTTSGNLHGTPVAYALGRAGFEAFPAVQNPVPEDRVCMIGLRSVDPAEKQQIEDSDMTYVDMRMIDERGIAAPLRDFLDRVVAENGCLHVSLDVDFIDPMIAPAVGTTVPGGATLREAHLVMEMLNDYGLMTSLDLVELNPFLDERGRTASVMVDLAASALGRRVFDRPTRAFA